MTARPALLVLLAALAFGACDSGAPDTAPAALGDTVIVAYEGRLEDGTVFDSRSRAQFNLVRGDLIDGFIDGVVGMRVGETKTFMVAPEDGYGDQGREGIPPNSTLTFEVTLLGVLR